MKLPLKFNPLPTSGPDKRGEVVDSLGRPIVRDIGVMDAAIVITACNAHGQMVEALKNAHPYVAHAGTRIEIGAALAAAGAT